ncbi:Ada metal-binding domain-containing protein [Pelagibacterium mangrovi]|uniref:Ada metal-binding domain-containing protein n=1 Tax=Pelagibacterium mangrovi TaxID=3119828 RepID=UPI002FC80CA3
MAELSETAELYASLAARDRRYLGEVFVGVGSTGIFCTMGCASRTPLEQNCRFFETVEDCVAAGFRACKRCRPE